MEKPSKKSLNDFKEAQAQPLIVEEIRRRLGEFGISNYTDLPRKHKKSAKKLAQGKALTQQELARLDAIRRQQSS